MRRLRWFYRPQPYPGTRNLDLVPVERARRRPAEHLAVHRESRAVAWTGEFLMCAVPPVCAPKVRACRRKGGDAAPRLPDHPRARLLHARIPAVDAAANKRQLPGTFGFELRQVPGIDPALLTGSLCGHEKIRKRGNSEPRANRGQQPVNRGAQESAAVCRAISIHVPSVSAGGRRGRQGIVRTL